MEHEEHWEQLTSIVHAKYKKLDDEGVVAIAPADVAAAAYGEIDPNDPAPPLVKLAAVLELRQLARAFCRKRHEHDESVVEQQGNLFDFQLQPRYPATRKQAGGSLEELYVKRGHLTLKERLKNIRRLGLEAERKTLHRDALKAETEFLVSIGQLKDEEAEVPAQ